MVYVKTMSKKGVKRTFSTKITQNYPVKTMRNHF
jgi:hypothetical protein